MCFGEAEQKFKNGFILFNISGKFFNLLRAHVTKFVNILYFSETIRKRAAHHEICCYPLFKSYHGAHFVPYQLHQLYSTIIYTVPNMQLLSHNYTNYNLRANWGLYQHFQGAFFVPTATPEWSKLLNGYNSSIVSYTICSSIVSYTIVL